MQGIRIRKRIDEDLFQRCLRNMRLRERQQNQPIKEIKKVEPKIEVIPQSTSRKCTKCGKKFNSEHPKKIYCSRHCQKLHSINRWKKKNPDKVKSYQQKKVNCINCNKEFIGKKCCSFECATAYIEKNFSIKEEDNKEEIIQKCEHCPHCNPKVIKKGELVKRNCKHCKKEYEYERKGPPKKYCTVECRTSYYSRPLVIEKTKAVTKPPEKKEIPVLEEEDNKEELKIFNPHDDAIDRDIKLTWPDLIKNYDGMTPKDLAYFRHAILARHNSFLEWKELTKGSKMKYDLYTELWKSGATGIMRHWRTS